MKKIVFLVIILVVLLSNLVNAKANLDDNGPWFNFYYSIGWGMGPPSSEKPGGVEFSVWIDDGAGFKEVYRANYVQLRWYPDAINLSEYQGKKIKIRIQTKHIENRIHMDYPYWGSPSISVGPINNLKEVKDLAMIVPDNYGGITDTGEIIKMEETCPVFGGASVLGAKMNTKNMIEIFSGDKYITVPGKALPGLFMGINMGTEYMRVGAGPLGEAYIGKMPPAVFAEWNVDVPVVEKPKQEVKKEESKQKIESSNTLMVLSIDNDKYLYKEGLFTNYDRNKMEFTAKTQGGTGYALSSFEASNLDKVNFKVTKDGNIKGYDDNSFAGLVIDYHSKDGYLKRVWLGMGAGSANRYDLRPGKWILDDASMSLFQRVSFEKEFVDVSKEINANNIYTLELSKYAPSNWDGRVWIGSGVQNLETPVTFTVALQGLKPYTPNPILNDIKSISNKFIKLQDSNVLVAISKKNGAICGIWNKNTNEKMFAEAADIYTIERRTSIINSSETYDIVKKVYKDKKTGGITFECESIIAPELKIIKTYKITQNGELSKKTTFDTTDKDGFFVKLQSATSVDPEFRKNTTGYGALTSRKVVAQGKVVELTDEVALEQAGAAAPPMLIKKDFSFGVAAFRYKVNDKYVMRAASKRLPTGFTCKIFTDFLKPQAKVSGEIYYKFFKGDIADFDKYYMSLPEYKEIYEMENPDWFSRVVCDAMYLQNSTDELNRKADPLIVTNTIWFYNSPWGNWGGYHENPDGMSPGTHGVAPGYRHTFPNARLAKYNNFLFDTNSDVYKDRQYWGVRTRDGELLSSGINSDSSAGPAFYFQILNPEVKKGLLDMHEDQLRQWKLDYYYTDGPGYGQEEIDWGYMDVTQNYDWLEYLKDLKDGLRSVNPDTVIFANGLMPYSSFSYIEYRDAQWQQQLTPEWRQIATELYQAKFEEPKGHVKVPTYGTMESDPALSAYTLLYGWLGNLTYAARYPFMEAAWEYRGIKLVDKALTPNWLTDQDAYFEADAFTKGNSAVVNIFNHDKNKDRVKVTLDAKKVNLKVGEPIFIYYLQMNDTAKIIKNSDGSSKYDETTIPKKGFREPVVISWGEACKDKIDIDVPAEFGHITSVVLTHSPALVGKVDNKESHTYIPEHLDVKIKGKKIGDSVYLNIDSRATSADIILPDFGLSDDINTWFKVEQCKWANKKALKITVPRGIHNLKFTKNNKKVDVMACNVDFDGDKLPWADLHSPGNTKYELVKEENRGNILRVTGDNVWSYFRQNYSIPEGGFGARYLSMEFDFRVIKSDSGNIPAFLNFELFGDGNTQDDINFSFDDKNIYYNGNVKLATYNKEWNHVKVVIDNETGKVSIIYNAEMWGNYDVKKWQQPELPNITWRSVRPFMGVANGSKSGIIDYDNIVVKSFN